MESRPLSNPYRVKKKPPPPDPMLLTTVQSVPGLGRKKALALLTTFHSKLPVQVTVMKIDLTLGLRLLHSSAESKFIIIIFTRNHETIQSVFVCVVENCTLLCTHTCGKLLLHVITKLLLRLSFYRILTDD